MKKTMRYSCDGGCLVIGNASCRFSVPNGYGDGEYRVCVTDDESIIPHDSRSVGRVEGDAINIYGYDCIDNINELCANVLLTIQGEYRVYVWSGDIFVLKLKGDKFR